MRKDTAPLVGDKDSHDEIRKKGCAQQLKNERNPGKGAENQQGRDETTGEKGPEPRGSGVKKLHA